MTKPVDDKPESKQPIGGESAADEFRSKPEGSASGSPSGRDTVPDGDAPVTEKDALLGLSDAGSERAESAMVTAIAEQITERLQRDPSGLRIGTLALFNDTVSFGGGFTTGGYAATASAGMTVSGFTVIDELRLGDHVDCFVRPERFLGALEFLQEHRLLVLACTAGSGREACAVNLIAEALAVTTKGACYLATESVSIGQADWRPPVPDSGYLVMLDGTSTMRRSYSDGLRPDAIDERWILEMASRVRAANSFMVLITGPPHGTLVEAAARSEHVWESLGSVDLEEIVERRVLGPEPDPDQSAELLRTLTKSGALDLIRELPEPGIAVRLATVIRAGSDLAAEVRSLRDPTRQVRVWFDRHRDLESQCFALAGAAVEGAGYLAVSDAAMRLHDLLVPSLKDPRDLRFRDRLSLDHPWIEVSVDPGSGDHPARFEPARVRFRNPLFQQAVLGYAWTYLDGYRNAIQDWLRELITNPDVDVRARSAVAAGVIAWSDYHHAVHRYLRSWSGSTSRMLRQGAAMALAVAGRHPDLVDPVWRLLESWAAASSTPFERRLSLTAVTAVGELGGPDPRRGMEVLRMALDREDWGTLLPAGVSVARLIERGHASEVLAALLDWSQPQDSSALVTKALSLFVFAARQPASTSGDRVADVRAVSAERPPLLLQQVRENRAQVVELWRRALARKPVQTQALDGLREYLNRCADRDPVMRGNVQDIVLGVAAGPGRHRERMEWYLRAWAEDRGNPSDSAGRIYQALRRMA